MKYFAIQLGSDGGMRYMHKTSDPRTVDIGVYQDKQSAVNAACHKLDCRQISRCILSRMNGSGGYMVVDEQQLYDMNHPRLTKVSAREINEQEMIDIFDPFAASLIDGYPCEELTEWFHESVRELAVDQTINIWKGDFTPLFSLFIESFSFDDENGSYLFRFEKLEFIGKTKIIRTEVTL